MSWNTLVGSEAVRSRGFFTALATAICLASSGGAVAQQVELASVSAMPAIHTPTGVVVHDGTQWVMSQSPAGDDGGIAGPGIGRCCLPSGSCQIVTQAQCQAMNGVYMGNDTTCAQFDCGQLGRCCINNDFVVTCQYVNLATCFSTLGGSYWQPGVTCAQSPCAPFGSCCRDFGGGPVCYITAQFLCEAQGGVWQGDNVSCAKVDCDAPAPGACCTSSGCVITRSEKDCDNLGGSYAGPNTDCTSCVGLMGMCCLGEDCIETTYVDCVKNRGGTYFGDGTFCGDYECDFDFPEAGACCLPDDTCSFTVEWRCDKAGGVFSEIDVLCADVDCSLIGAPGACCLGDTCVELPEQECFNRGGEFAGKGVPCNPSDCPDMLGQCCIPFDNCQFVTIDQCFDVLGGAVWIQTSENCVDVPQCAPLGACCLPAGGCQMLPEWICVSSSFNGTYKGDYTTCADPDGNGVAEVCEDPGDVDGNGVTNIDDLLSVIGAWGPCPQPCPQDIFPAPNGNGVVNIDDLLAVISGWG